MPKTNKDLAVKINPELYFQIKEMAIVEGKKINFLINRALSNYLKIRSNKKTKR